MDKKIVQLESNFLYHHALWLKEQDSLFDFASFTKVIKKAENEENFWRYVEEFGEKELNYILTYYGKRNFYLNLSKFLVKSILDDFVPRLKKALCGIVEEEESRVCSYSYKYYCQTEESSSLVLDWILTYESIFSFFFSMEKDRVYIQRKNCKDLYQVVSFSKKESFSIYREEKYKENIDVVVFMLILKINTICDLLGIKDESILGVEASGVKVQKLSLKNQSDYVEYVTSIVNFLTEFFSNYTSAILAIKIKLEKSCGKKESREDLVLDQDGMDELSLSIGTRDLEAAKKASQDLGQYMSEHGLLPDQMIDAELTGINPLLTKDSLNIVKSQLKMKKMTRVNYFLNSVKRAKKFLMAGLVLVFILIGCGVKTAPRSDIIESRPSIDFHEQNGQK